MADSGYSETQSVVSSSSKVMLNKLKDAASLAISVTTGRKPAFGAKEKSLTNIIPGFGYALMDVFENEFVEMESIQKILNKQQIIEENASPFASPSKSKTKRDKSLNKDETKKNRKEQRKKDLEEYEKKREHHQPNFPSSRSRHLLVSIQSSTIFPLSQMMRSLRVRSISSTSGEEIHRRLLSIHSDLLLQPRKMLEALPNSKLTLTK